MKTKTTLNNKVLYYLLVLILHPLLLWLIIIIVNITLFIYFFADPVLCQDESVRSIGEGISSNSSAYNSDADYLKELRCNIESYEKEGEKAIKEHNRWMALLREAYTRPEKNEDIQKYLSEKVKDSLEDYHALWRKNLFAKRMLKEIEKQSK